jgi:hypothetical protein
VPYCMFFLLSTRPVHLSGRLSVFSFASACIEPCAASYEAYNLLGWRALEKPWYPCQTANRPPASISSLHFSGIILCIFSQGYPTSCSCIYPYIILRFSLDVQLIAIPRHDPDLCNPDSSNVLPSFSRPDNFLVGLVCRHLTSVLPKSKVKLSPKGAVEA